MKSLSDKWIDRILLILGILVFVVTVYPLYFVVIASFSSPSAVSGGQVWLFPKSVTLEGYRRVFENERIWLGYRNTIFYTIAGTLISLAFTLPAGYALSRKDLVGRNAISLFFVFTMYFSGGLIPTYFIVDSFHLTNTFWVIILPFAVNVYHLIIVRTFFQSTIPDDLLEVSQLDGCSNTRFFVSIVLPLSKAILAVVGLYSAVSLWNQYFTSLVYVRDDSLVPLQLVLREILLQNQTVSGAASVSNVELQKVGEIMKYAVIIVSTVPIMCVYPFLQKYFNKGVMVGAIKG
ncbi:MAG: carbohydrate ABC transporter permease [Eubacteriales bacterium]|nr:carbohydrate ABC transporter permease [Eubacteriales bacterium]